MVGSLIGIALWLHSSPATVHSEPTRFSGQVGINVPALHRLAGVTNIYLEDENLTLEVETNLSFAQQGEIAAAAGRIYLENTSSREYVEVVVKRNGFCSTALLWPRDR